MTEEELLRDEYLALQKGIEDFDAKALTIKAWSVTLSAAGLSVAYVQHEPTILLVAAASALIFWFVEALWKALQRGHYPRLEEIENHFSDTGPRTKPFKIAATRRQLFRDRRLSRRAVDVVFWPHVMLPHVLVAMVGAVLYFAAPPPTAEAPPAVSSRK